MIIDDVIAYTVTLAPKNTGPHTDEAFANVCLACTIAEMKQILLQ